jgi:hypothetical protein
MAQPAAEVKVVFTAETTTWSAALDKAQRQLDALKGATRSAGELTRKEMGEARGSIALMGEEFGIHLPRHVRSFVAELPGVASAMSAAFNAVAIFAIADAIFKAGEKVVEFAEKTENAARKNEAAWREAGESLKSSNAELLLASTRLESQIARLEHKPENKVAEAMAEAAVEAEHLEQRLDGVLKRYEDLLKVQAPGMMSEIVGQAGTSYEQTMLREHQRHMGDQTTVAGQAQESESFRRSLLTRANELDALKNGRTSYNDADGNAHKIDPYRFGNPSYGKEIEAVQVMQGVQGAESTNIGLVQRLEADRDQYGKDQAHKAAEDAEKQAAQKSIEAAGEQLEAIKARSTLTSKAEADFWQHLASTAIEGSTLYTAAIKRANAARAGDLKQSQAELGQYWVQQAHDQDRARTADDQIDAAVDATFTAEGRRIEAAQKKMEQSALEAFKLAEQSQRAAEQIQEERIKLDVAMGRLSKYEGARQLQSLHDQSFADWSKAAADFRAQFPDLRTPGAAEAIGQYGKQSLQDGAAVDAASALGGLRKNAMELAIEFTDVSAIAKNLLVQSLQSFNDTIVKILSSRDGMQGMHEWRQMGSGMVQTIGKDALQYGEGSILKMLLGKDPSAKLGTKGNPMHTIVENAGGGSGSGGGGGLGGGILGYLNNADWSTKGWMGDLFGAGGLFGGAAADALTAGAGAGVDIGSEIASEFGGLAALADGGPTPANMPILVGEEGPEVFNPSTSGRIIPHSEIGGGSPKVYVDARGAEDPAATEARVHRAMGAYLPHMGSMARNAVSDDARRTPSSRRR